MRGGRYELYDTIQYMRWRHLRLAGENGAVLSMQSMCNVVESGKMRYNVRACSVFTRMLSGGLMSICRGDGACVVIGGAVQAGLRASGLDVA